MLRPADLSARAARAKRASPVRRWWWLVLLTLLGTECARDEIILRTADGRGLTAAQVDQDALVLLPGDSVALAYLDAQDFFASPLGQKTRELAPRFIPIPAAANFELARDVRNVYLGLYSATGMSALAVVKGNFNLAAIERAVAAQEPTPLGIPLARSTYAGRVLFTAHNVGFSILTTATALFGNESGMRRALDRISDGRVTRQVPPWAVDLFERPRAPLVGAVARNSGVLSAATLAAPFLAGLERVRAIGNFQSPGLNLAGTALYGDAAQAQSGAQSLAQVNNYLQSWGIFATLLGIQQPVRQFAARSDGPTVEFVAGLDAQAVAILLDQLGNATMALGRNPKDSK